MSTGNLSLNKRDQSQFDASVKRLKKKVEDGDLNEKEFKPRERGVVRLSRIPHGFYESEMKNFFSQFGVVTRLRLARSKKTGNSKGFAYLEFKFPDVAKVVADTMNNYLMFDKIMKAIYIPPDEQKFDYFRGVSKDKVPAEKNRKIAIATYNRKLSRAERATFYEKLSQNLKKQLNRIKALGIEYEFKPITKYKTKKGGAVLMLDESDDEITFKIPPNVQVVKKGSTKAAVLEEASSSKKPSLPKEASLNVVSFKGKVKNETSKDDSCIQNVEEHKKNVKMSMKSPFESIHAKNRSINVEKSKLRGVRKSKGLKVMGKMPKNRTMSIVKMKLSGTKSPKSLISSWQVKECD